MEPDNQLRILIVEDVPTDAELAERELRQNGFSFETTRVDKEDEFLEALKNFKPDLVISDYVMPEFDGMEALKLAQAHDPNLPLIVLTGSMNEETAVECMKAGATDYVIKEHLTRLPFAVKGALDQKKTRLARAQAEKHLQQRLQELEVMYSVSSALRTAATLDEMLPLLLDEILEALQAEAGAIWLYDTASSELYFAVARGWFNELDDSLLRPGEGIGGVVFSSGEPYVTSEFAGDPQFKYREKIPAGWGGVCVPIQAASETVGVLFVSVQHPRKITSQELKMLTSLSEMAGMAVHRISLHDQTVRRLNYLQSLRAVDQAITANLDLNLTLNTLLEHVINQLKVDAACIFLLQPHLKKLKYAAGRGFRSKILEDTTLTIGESCAGLAALNRQIFQVNSIDDAPDHNCATILQIEGFKNCISVPLISKGDIKGVLMIFQHNEVRKDPEWTNFLETMGTQAAIAIDNATLFDDLQQANLELSLAYDATIEGWARALELRDYETEGHTRRVAELTVEMAQSMGMPEKQLVHVRRGALLHDIGKMGIPDAILFKPGSLTEEEWEVMKKHPLMAYEMIASIDYLRPALNIPYYHHERWDGSGYPEGLKGENIPLEARIFSVIDVFDALTSDRPYRSAWSDEQAFDYIRREKGRHFDPGVADLFLEKMKQG